ncbi:MAG: cation-transporting P-type ATPase, partial [Spirochaetales bacterium]|nr:cation-transporting P-type ATPase [Spirochaetales bacterium]
MQRFILGKKHFIMLSSAVLIITAFALDLGFNLKQIAVWFLAAASALGLAPIAIQAFQALKVKVVSIDVLVTIAVIGAFALKNFEE